MKIIVSRSHQGEIEKTLKANFKEKIQLVVAAGAGKFCNDRLSVFSITYLFIGYKVLEVAYGNVDSYMHATEIKKWDICAGNAIINAKKG